MIPNHPRKRRVVEWNATREGKLRGECESGRTGTQATDTVVVDEDAVGTGMPSYSDKSGVQTAVVLGTKRVEPPADNITEILGRLGRCGLHGDGRCG